MLLNVPNERINQYKGAVEFVPEKVKSVEAKKPTPTKSKSTSKK